MKNFEYQYYDSLVNILKNGIKTKNRTGIDTFKIQHQYFFIENVVSNFPLIKGKKVYPKMALKELVWMMNGRTDVKWLQDRGVSYWDEWQDENGTIGKSYGHQFRNFNGVDNFGNVLKELINDPMSRRLLLNLWNVSDLSAMKLPPCLYDFHFECTPLPYTSDNNFYLDMYVTSRSEDAFLGQPYDFAYVGWFLNIMAFIATKLSNTYFYARNIHFTAHNYHLYRNHIPQVTQYIKNVEENRNKIIESKAFINFKEFQMFTTLDGFLSQLDDNKFKQLNLLKEYKESDEYSPIQADIAV